MLAVLAERLDGGLTHWDLSHHDAVDYSQATMDQLVKLGAIEACEDEFLDIRFRLRPAGVTWNTKHRVHRAVPDVNLINGFQTDNVANCLRSSCSLNCMIKASYPLQPSQAPPAPPSVGPTTAASCTACLARARSI